MPVTLLAALIIAFGFEGTAPAGALSGVDLAGRLADAAIGVGFVAAVALGYAAIVRRGMVGGGEPSRGLRKLRGVAGPTIDVVSLVVYAWIIHVAGWPRAMGEVAGRWGSACVAVSVFAPYLVERLAVAVGMHAAERAWRRGRGPGLGSHLVRRGRQLLGLFLPLALVSGLGREVGRHITVGGPMAPYVELAGMAASAALVLCLAPLFIRLSWPTHRLEDGPLRDRLERLSKRLGFRCTQILVWETGGGVVNAGVTGLLPFFRYVLLSDALIAELDPREVEAVFGHEVGHVAHRHFRDYGLFLIGSLGVLTLADRVAAWALPMESSAWASTGRSACWLLAMGGYFLGVFGLLSRRFERQADVYGCRAVSCGRQDCPPTHADVNAADSGIGLTPLCPAGIRIFAGALTRVAESNGMQEGPLAAFLAWRHGRISRRVAFLLRMEGRPEAEPRFQRGVVRLRLMVGAGLVAAWILAARG